MFYGHKFEKLYYNYNMVFRLDEALKWDKYFIMMMIMIMMVVTIISVIQITSFSLSFSIKAQLHYQISSC